MDTTWLLYGVLNGLTFCVVDGVHWVPRQKKCDRLPLQYHQLLFQCGGFKLFGFVYWPHPNIFINYNKSVFVRERMIFQQTAQDSLRLFVSWKLLCSSVWYFSPQCTGGRFIQMRQHPVNCWYFGGKWVLEVRIDVSELRLSADALVILSTAAK